LPYPIEASTLRILNSKGQAIGTGFLVSKNLVVTCAHVVTSIGLDAENRIRVQFTGEDQKLHARVLNEFLDFDRDVAILEIEAIPTGVHPLRMERAATCRLNAELYTFGYASAAGENGISGLGYFRNFAANSQVFQFRMHEADHGHSGAPVLDVGRGVIIGMVQKGKTEPGRNDETTFAIPIETIWQVCPQLKPIVSPLPRRNPIVEGINLLPYDYDQRIQNFLTEYLGNDQHPVPFGGRDEALRMLDAWLAEATPHLLLAAPAGRGKSALLVRWLDSLKAREDLALTFVPVSIRFGTNMERVFYAALAARLAYLHGDDVPASPETSTAVYRGLVSDYLSKPLANGRTLLVVLDGLDEAADWQAGAYFLPSELPAGVRVVVSARFLAGDADSTPWLRRLNWERSGMVSAPALVPLDRAGVADILLKMGCPLDELSRKVDIVAEMYRLSEGDPLLVGLYVDDLWDKREIVARLKPEDLADIQPGYKGYFDDWWKYQKELWGKDKKPWFEKHVRALRNLLAGALGTLFKDDFQSLNPELESEDITDALDVLQRFIIGDNQTQGYTFSHPKLGQYFWEALTPTEQAKVEERFLAWGERTLQEFIDGKRDPKKKADVPVYVVRNYGAHLARAEPPIEKWLPLIHHQQWAQAWFTVEGAYGGCLRDVQRVWERCKVLDRETISAGQPATQLGKQIRCALIEGSLHSLAESIPPELIPALVQAGFWTLAQALVKIRHIPDAMRQAEVINRLLPQLTEEELSKALETARAIDNQEARSRVLSALTQRLPEVSDEALEAVRAIGDQDVRDWVLSDLAQHLPEGELGQVLEATRAIQDEESRAHMLSVLAQRLPKGALGQVLEAARAIQDERSRAHVLSKLVQRLPSLTGEALEAAQAIRNEMHRADVLSTLAQRLPEGELGQVLEAARAIEDEEYRASALSSLAQRLPKVTGEALEAAKAIRDEESRADMLSVLVQHLPEGDLGQVLEAARAIEDKEYRTRVLSVLAQRLPGVVGEAMAATWVIQDEYEHARVVSVLVQYLPEGNLGEVLAAARAIQNEGVRANVLCELAQRLPGMAGEALEAARVIQDEYGHAKVLSVLVQCLPGVAGEALEAALAIQNEEYRAKVLSELAHRMPEGKLGQVLAEARAIHDEEYRAEVLSELAHRMPEGKLGQVLAEALILEERFHFGLFRTLALRLPEGELGQVLELARVIWGEIEGAFMLSVLAQRLPGIAGEALAATRAIQNEWRCGASVLSELAQRLPEEELGQVLEVARAIKYEEFRARVLSTLAQRLPEEELGRVLEMARAMQSVWYRAEVLSSLAQRLPLVTSEALAAAWAMNELDRARMLSELTKRLPEGALGQVLEAARAIRDESKRADVLSALAQRLPMIAGEALEAARAIEDEEFRARVLSVLAQHLPDVAGEALAAARAIQVGEYRAEVLSALAQPFIRAGSRECYPSIESMLGTLFLRARDDLFSNLAALMPVIIHIGTDDTPHEIYEAVRDVTAWWP